MCTQIWKHLFHAITTQSCEGKPRVTGFILLLVTVAQKFCLCPSLLWAFCGCTKLFNGQQSSLRRPSRLSSTSHECRQRQTGSWGTATGNNMAEEFGCLAGIWFRESCCKRSRAASRFPSRCADARQKQTPLLSDGAGSQQRAFQGGGRSQVLKQKRLCPHLDLCCLLARCQRSDSPAQRRLSSVESDSPSFLILRHDQSTLSRVMDVRRVLSLQLPGPRQLNLWLFTYNQPCLFPLRSPEEIPQHIKLDFKLLKTRPHAHKQAHSRSCAPAGWSIDSENFKQLLVPVQKV